MHRSRLNAACFQVQVSSFSVLLTASRGTREKRPLFSSLFQEEDHAQENNSQRMSCWFSRWLCCSRSRLKRKTRRTHLQSLGSQSSLTSPIRTTSFQFRSKFCCPSGARGSGWSRIGEMILAKIQVFFCSEWNAEMSQFFCSSTPWQVITLHDNTLSLQDLLTKKKKISSEIIGWTSLLTSLRAWNMAQSAGKVLVVYRTW